MRNEARKPNRDVNLREALRAFRRNVLEDLGGWTRSRCSKSFPIV